MNLWGEEFDCIYVECEKCGKVLKFDKKYFDYIGGNWKPNLPLSCFCGNKTDNFLSNHRSSAFSQNNTPHCPTCGSTNIEKISGANKVGKALLFGVLAAGSISKTFRCRNCGYKW